MFNYRGKVGRNQFDITVTPRATTRIEIGAGIQDDILLGRLPAPASIGRAGLSRQRRWTFATGTRLDEFAKIDDRFDAQSEYARGCFGTSAPGVSSGVRRSPRVDTAPPAGSPRA